MCGKSFTEPKNGNPSKITRLGMIWEQRVCALKRDIATAMDENKHLIRENNELRATNKTIIKENEKLNDLILSGETSA